MYTVAEGWWCQVCEFFEDDGINTERVECENCGHDGSDHIRVEVIEKGPS